MLRLQISEDIYKKFYAALKAANRRETGGVLVAEKLGDATFKLVDISVQKSTGTSDSFVRNPIHAGQFLDGFDERNGVDFKKVNYLGEWHSHPNHFPLPSALDADTMQGIVDDDSVSATFAVLLIVRLVQNGLMIHGSVYIQDQVSQEVSIVFERQQEESSGKESFVKKAISYLIKLASSR